MICWKKDPEGRWKKRRKEKGRRMKDHGLGGRKWKKGDSRKEEARTRREGIRKIESARKGKEERHETASGRRKKKEERVQRQAVDNEKARRMNVELKGEERKKEG
jgi:hypothetical protein